MKEKGLRELVQCSSDTCDRREGRTRGLGREGSEKS